MAISLQGSITDSSLAKVCAFKFKKKTTVDRAKEMTCEIDFFVARDDYKRTSCNKSDLLVEVLPEESSSPQRQKKRRFSRHDLSPASL